MSRTLERKVLRIWVSERLAADTPISTMAEQVGIPYLDMVSLCLTSGCLDGQIRDMAGRGMTRYAVAAHYGVLFTAIDLRWRSMDLPVVKQPRVRSKRLGKPMTMRQVRQIWALVDQRHTYSQVAKQMGITIPTVVRWIQRREQMEARKPTPEK